MGGQRATPRGGHPRRDPGRAGAAHHLRALHGACPDRARPGLLREQRAAADAQRRLPHGPGAAPLLRALPGTLRGRCLGTRRFTAQLPGAGVRGRPRHAAPRRPGGPAGRRLRRAGGSRLADRGPARADGGRAWGHRARACRPRARQRVPRRPAGPSARAAGDAARGLGDLAGRLVRRDPGGAVRPGPVSAAGGRRRRAARRAASGRLPASARVGAGGRGTAHAERPAAGHRLRPRGGPSCTDRGAWPARC